MILFDDRNNVLSPYFVLQGVEFWVMLRQFVWSKTVCKGPWPKVGRIHCVQGEERG